MCLGTQSDILVLHSAGRGLTDTTWHHLLFLGVLLQVQYVTDILERTSVVLVGAIAVWSPL